MRWAVFGPTPGRRRNAAISSSSDEGVFIRKGRRKKDEGRRKPQPALRTPSAFCLLPSSLISERQLHARRQGQPCRRGGHLLLRDRLDPAHSVVHRRGDQV